MKTPKISILIPVYNRKRYIAECIQSALEQTFTDFEIVIVDNASDDGTWEICQQFAAKDSRIRIYRNKENFGPVRNWQRCAQEARGEYSKILFSDDTLNHDCLARMQIELQDPKVAFVFCAALIGESKERALLAYSHRNLSRMTARQYINYTLQGRAPVSPGAVMLRTTDLKANLHTDFPTAMQHHYDKHGAGPDVMIMFLTGEKYSQIAHINSPLVYFRAHSDSFSIANAGGQIQKAYESIFSYCLRRQTGRTGWRRYVAGCWVRGIWKNKKWSNPRRFLLSHNGNGSAVEHIYLFIFSILKLLMIPFNRLIKNKWAWWR